MKILGERFLNMSTKPDIDKGLDCYRLVVIFSIFKHRCEWFSLVMYCMDLVVLPQRTNDICFYSEYFTTKPISLLDSLNQIKAQRLCIDLGSQIYIHCYGR